MPVAQEGGQAPLHFDLDCAWRRRVTMDSHGFHQFAHGLRAFAVSRADPLRQTFVKKFELLLISFQDPGVQRYGLVHRWGFRELCENVFALIMKFGGARANHTRISDALRQLIDQSIDLTFELTGAALQPSSFCVRIGRETFALLMIGLHIFSQHPRIFHFFP
ncbi:hypothetical protein [Roseibium salinum]|uniref:Uncharacterized protein n=1 Tax=Roseibium salinum TaxID=1604349 RepID=A0ABT3R9Q6_9HYPH|nr:hypothetical protein [Roseibium sp. DSM 29163]MCX2725818.1 hypothetical protein [Roseibium sp. DSM 29163]